MRVDGSSRTIAAGRAKNTSPSDGDTGRSVIVRAGARKTLNGAVTNDAHVALGDADLAPDVRRRSPGAEGQHDDRAVALGQRRETRLEPVEVE